MELNSRVINSTKSWIMYLGLLVQGIKAEGLKKIMGDANETSWFIDPTWYRDNADHLDDFALVLEHLVGFQKASKAWLEKHGEKSELKLTVNKLDDFRKWLLMEFMINTPPEMKNFMGLDEGDESE